MKRVSDSSASRSDHTPMGHLAVRLGVWGFLLLAWELWGRTQSPYFFTYPTAILRAMTQMLASGEMQEGLMVSLKGLMVGFSLAAVIAVPLGLIAGRIAYLRRLLNPIMMAFYVTPRLALIPL